MPLIIQEAQNLFVGDDTQNTSKHRNLSSMKLPTLEEKSADHYGGGAIGEIAVGGLGLNKLEATFKLIGHDPQVQSKFGVYNTPYTVYGLLRDKDSGKPQRVKAIIWGRLGKIESDEFKRGDLLGHDHMISEILRYACYYDEAEKYYYDIRTSDWRVDGIDRYADERRILAIPGA